MDNFADLKIALVHHWFIRRGGAERVVEVLADMFPRADIFTLLAAPGGLGPSLTHRRIQTSFLQRWPGSRRHHRLLLPFYPLALESLDLSGYDLVISSESGPSKGVLTGAGTLHICYCHSPMRYLWEMPHHYRQTAPGGWLGRAAFSLASHYVRNWDYATAARVDHFVASSANGAKRIQKHYRRQASIIYPPVDTGNFSLDTDSAGPGDFYLIVSRLVSYKRIDLAIGACNRLKRRLVIIGEGEQREKLERLAGPTVSFLGVRSDEDVHRHLRRCRAFLFPGEEDIGLSPIEAQASGRPVIAFGRGGALETVRPLQPGASAASATGVFFYETSEAAMVEALQAYEAAEPEWSPERIRSHALQFDQIHFRRQMLSFIADRLARPSGAAVGV